MKIERGTFDFQDTKLLREGDGSVLSTACPASGTVSPLKMGLLQMGLPRRIGESKLQKERPHTGNILYTFYVA